jgi:hypothetical protein
MATILASGIIEVDASIIRMDRAFADAVILEVLQRDPERVRSAIANVARAMEADGRYSAEDIEAGTEELLSELEGHFQPQH